MRHLPPARGKSFLKGRALGMAADFPVLPKAPSLRELAHEVRLKEYFSYGLLPSSPDGLATAPLFVTCVTSAPLFVTCGDISPRRGENLSRPGEVFLMEGGFWQCGRLSGFAKATERASQLKEIMKAFVITLSCRRCTPSRASPSLPQRQGRPFPDLRSLHPCGCR